MCVRFRAAERALASAETWTADLAPRGCQRGSIVLTTSIWCLRPLGKLAGQKTKLAISLGEIGRGFGGWIYRISNPIFQIPELQIQQYSAREPHSTTLALT